MASRQRLIPSLWRKRITRTSGATSAFFDNRNSPNGNRAISSHHSVTTSTQSILNSCTYLTGIVRHNVIHGNIPTTSAMLFDPVCNNVRVYPDIAHLLLL